MNGIGPTKQKPTQIKISPIIVANFGLKHLSNTQPNIGAVKA